jgi:hypothetical protein
MRVEHPDRARQAETIVDAAQGGSRFGRSAVGEYDD